MTDMQLHHDPRTKQQIKDMLYETLYAPVQKAFKAKLDTLIIKNTMVSGTSHKSFSYKGQDYTCDTTPMPRLKTRLVPQLRPEMDKYLAQLKELNDEELPYVLGYINQVLNSSDYLQDYLKMFPSALHPPLEKTISSCPCRSKRLDESTMALLQKKNARSVDLIKQRMVRNLLI